MLPKINRANRKSTIFNVISSLLDRNDSTSLVAQQDFKTLVGNGASVYFWAGDWIDTGSLKDNFSWVYALALNKQGPVVSFGSQNHGIWRWNISLKRRSLDWETQIWDSFNSTIEDMIIDENNPNIVI